MLYCDCFEFPCWHRVIVSVSIWIQTVKQDTSLSFGGTKASIHMNSSTPHKNPSLPAVCSNILSCQHDNSTEILFTVASSHFGKLSEYLRVILLLLFQIDRKKIKDPQTSRLHFFCPQVPPACMSGIVFYCIPKEQRLIEIW